MLSKGAIKILLDNIVILVDTREKSNAHIIEYFEKQGIKYEIKKLDYGDYSCYIPVVENIDNPMFDFREIISIERKADLNELAGNLTKGRERFENELKRVRGKMILMIEGNSYVDLWRHDYRSEYNPTSYNASLMTYRARYGLELNFLSNKKCAGVFIYTSLYYTVREFLNSIGNY